MEGIKTTPQIGLEPIPNRVKAKRKRKVSKISDKWSTNAIRDKRVQWLGMGSSDKPQFCSKFRLMMSNLIEIPVTSK